MRADDEALQVGSQDAHYGRVAASARMLLRTHGGWKVLERGVETHARHYAPWMSQDDRVESVNMALDRIEDEPGLLEEIARALGTQDPEKVLERLGQRIAGRQARKRRSYRETPLEQERWVANNWSPEERVARDEQLRALHQSAPIGEREALEALLDADGDYARAAAALGINENALYVRVFRLRRRLKALEEERRRRN